MEEFRRCRLQDLAILIQKKFRSYSKRKHYLRLKQSQIIIARAWRTWRVSVIITSTTNTRKYI